MMATTPSSIKQERMGSIDIFPNPTQDQVFIRVDAFVGTGTVLLMDMQGKTLQRSRFQTGIQSMDVARYGAGMYLLVFQTKNGIQTKKLIIE